MAGSEPKGGLLQGCFRASLSGGSLGRNHGAEEMCTVRFRPHLVFSSTQFGRLGMAHVCIPINLLEKLETLFEPYSLTFAREPPTPIAPHTKCATGLGYCLRWFLDGALRVTQWLQEAGFLRCSSAGWDNAAGGGHLHVLKVIFRQLRVPFSVHGRNDSWSDLLGYYTNAKQYPPPHVCPCIPANY